MDTIKLRGGNPVFSSIFKHINAEEQIQNLSIDTELIASGAITTDKIDIDNNLNFNENESLEFRLENVSSTPLPGNPGRLVWNTALDEVLIDTGTAFVPVSSITGVASLQIDSNPPLTGNIQFVSGANIVLSQVGQVVTIQASGTLSSTYQQDLFTVTDPTNKEFDLSYQPVGNSTIVSWNGQVLRPGVTNDYIVVTNPTNQVQLSGLIILHVGDTIMVSYAR
jgi:hypothetical protein